MPLRALRRSTLLMLLAALSLPACSKKDAVPEGLDAASALTHSNEGSALVFSVAPNGQLQLLVRGPDGKPIESRVTGSVTLKPTEPKAEPVKVALVQDPKTKLMVAAMPELADDLTEVKYDLTINDKPVKGVMYLPVGGTKELDENAKEAGKVKIPPGKKGPNGGVLQVVGNDVVEIVAGKKNGALRVYVLDPDLKPVPVGTRKIKLVLVTPKGPETVVLAADPGGAYFVGKISVVENPSQITVVLTDHDHTEVVLCGYEPGNVIVVGPSAPVLVILASVVWDVDVVVLPPPPVIMIHGKGKGKWGFRKHKHW
jgi:hypothetical protein